MRRKNLIAIGVILILLAMGLTAYNLIFDYKSEINSTRLTEKLISSIEENKQANNFEIDESEAEQLTIEGNNYVGIIEIPKIDICLGVLKELNTSNLKLSPCVFSGKPEESNFVIGAHNTLSHFGKLKELEKNDMIEYTICNGEKIQYSVEEIEILSSISIDEMKYSNYDLTLFTCTIGGQSRLAIRCKKI